jgi:hypothetical protein
MAPAWLSSIIHSRKGFIPSKNLFSLLLLLSLSCGDIRMEELTKK